MSKIGEQGVILSLSGTHFILYMYMNLDMTFLCGAWRMLMTREILWRILGGSDLNDRWEDFEAVIFNKRATWFSQKSRKHLSHIMFKETILMHLGILQCKRRLSNQIHMEPKNQVYGAHVNKYFNCIKIKAILIWYMLQ